MNELSLEFLASVSGGMDTSRMCMSYNVEDRRPGAPSRKEQIRQTDEANRAIGCPVYADLHPTPARRK